MILLEDTRNQPGKHDMKNKYFADHGIEVRRTKLYVGDYTLPADQSVCIDTKKDIQELIGDICGPSHDRFRNECIRAQEANVKLIVLVENEAGYVDRKQTIYNNVVRSVDDLFSWVNPRLFIWKGGKQKYPMATKGAVLEKCCITMAKKYGVEFQFCTPEEAGERILSLLNVKQEE